jgi:hypothetical protein
LSCTKTATRKLERLQNKALRSITGAYKATPTRALEAEAFVLPVPLFLLDNAKKYRDRTGFIDREKEKKEALLWIRKRTRQRRTPLPPSSPLPSSPSSSSSPSLLEAWQERWNSQPRDKWGITLPPDKRSLRLYKGLAKAESSVLFQLRTGRIGLPQFLFKRKVPDYPTPYCPCGSGIGSTTHFLCSCLLYSDSRPRGFEGKTKEDLLSNLSLSKTVVKWAIQTGALPQFDLTSTLLYDPP